MTFLLLPCLMTGSRERKKVPRSPRLSCELNPTLTNLGTLDKLLGVQTILRNVIAVFTYWAVVEIMVDCVDEALSLGVP